MIDRMENVEVNPEIEQFLPAIISKLSWLDKEDIIRNFVSLEFNQMLEHYKGARDLNMSFSKSKDMDKGKGKRDRKEKRDRKPKHNGKSSGFSRIFMNVGKKDRISPKSIIGMVNRHMPDEDVKIGQIEILNNFSFFEVDRSYEQDVLSALSDVKHKGTNIGVELAKEKA